MEITRWLHDSSSFSRHWVQEWAAYRLTVTNSQLQPPACALRSPTTTTTPSTTITTSLVVRKKKTKKQGGAWVQGYATTSPKLTTYTSQSQTLPHVSDQWSLERQNSISSSLPFFSLVPEAEHRLGTRLPLLSHGIYILGAWSSHA